MECKGIGKRIRQKRLERSWRQEDLAEKTGLSSTYIGMIERGEKTPSLETFVMIANALGVSADILLTDNLENGYQIRMSEYIDKIGKLQREKRKVIYDVIEVLLKDIK